MSKFITSQTNFKAGVLSPKLHGRIDIKEYQDGLSIGDNAFIAKQGGTYKRPSSVANATFGNNSNAKLITAFIGGRSFTFCFYSNQFQVLDVRGENVSTGFSSHGGTYTPDDFSIATFENIVIITHYRGDYEPRYVTFVDGVVDSILSIREGSFSGRPLVAIDPDIEMRLLNASPSPLSNITPTLESNASYFTADMVGEWVRLEGITKIQGSNRIASNMYKILTYISPTQVTVQGRFSFSGAPAVTDFLANTEWNNTLDVYQPVGYDATIIPSLGGPFNSEWFEICHQSAWSDRLGWPTTVAVDEGRVIFGGSPTYPMTIWGSKVNEIRHFLDKRFFNSSFSWRLGSKNARNETIVVPYDGEILSTDPYQFVMASKRGSKITWMQSGVNFFIGTTDQEFILSGAGNTISQKNISIRPHTSHGSAKLRSASFDNTVIYVGRDLLTLHMLMYNESNGSYVNKELSLLSGSFDNFRYIRDIVWHETLGILFVLKNNGSITAVTLNSETQTIAFTDLVLDKQVSSMSFGLSDLRVDDCLNIVVSRNGRTYLERIGLNFDSFVASEIPVDRRSYLDSARLQSTSELNNICKILDKTDSFMYADPSQFKVGDIIEFQTGDLTGTGLTLSTLYYAIPYESASGGGLRLATSLANAQAGTFIVFTGTGIQGFYSNFLAYDITRVVQEIPTAHIPSGEDITVIAWDGSELTEFSFTSTGAATYDLGQVYASVAYGYRYLFHIATLPIEAGQQWGSSQLGIKRIDKASVRVYQTNSYQIGTDGYNMEDRILGLNFDLGGEFTGRDEVAVTGNPEYDHIIHIQNDKAEPCYISNLVLRGVSNDG